MGLAANQPRLEARRIRQQLQLSGQRMSAEYLYDLVLLETGDEDEASRAAAALMSAELKAGLKPL